MENERKQFLINLFEQRKGQRGRFTYLFDEYNPVIISMHIKGETIFSIGDFIENDMDYTFTRKKYDKTDPFYRSLDLYLKKKANQSPKKLAQSQYPLTHNECYEKVEKSDRSHLNGHGRGGKSIIDHDPS